MILVTGATGTVGREVVRLLVAAGATVRAMSRDPSRAKLPGAEVVQADFEHEASLDAAMQGVERAFLLSAGPSLGKHEGRAARAARRAGVKHLVKVSTYGVQSPEMAIARWHLDGEQQVAAAGVPCTFLRPSGFMSNALGWVAPVKATGSVFGILGDFKAAPIHPHDIAACAVKVLLEDGHAGRAYLLTGAEQLSMSEQAQVLSEALGRPVRYVDVPEERLRENLLKAGRPPAIAEAVIELQRWIRSIGGGPISSDVATLLGRAPLSWAQWCRENAAAFR